MTSSNRNIFRATGPLWVESTGHRWISLKKASDGEFWCFPWSAHEQRVESIYREAGDMRRHRAHYDVTVMINLILPAVHPRKSLRYVRCCICVVCRSSVLPKSLMVTSLTSEQAFDYTRNSYTNCTIRLNQCQESNKHQFCALKHNCLKLSHCL